VIGYQAQTVAPPYGALNPQPDRTGQVVERPVAAEIERLDIGGDQFFLRPELLGQQLLDRLWVDVEESGKRTHVDDVLEQLALAGVAVAGVAHLGQRHAKHGDVGAELRRRQRLGVVIEKIAAGDDGLDVLIPGLRVHRHHQVGAAARAQVAGRRDTYFVPRGQALDVAGEDVARRRRHPHADDRPGKQRVGTGRARSVDVGEFHHEVVDRLQLAHASAPAAVRCGATDARSNRKRCMSHAPVGQRSAHRPQ